ncbi:hypothetical protein [Kribbella sp. NPDC048928]|uniref:hypothetical protein n=1 Tax=Kribbella sp. NPDC048928 TaxID=3364111 RepID=UPI0037240F68
MSNQQPTPRRSRAGWIVLGVVIAFVLSGLVIVGVQTISEKHRAAAERAEKSKPSATASATPPPDGTYCYGCFYTMTLPAFRSHVEANGYACQAEAADRTLCTKGKTAVVTFRKSAQHPSRLGIFSVRTSTPGPFDRAKGNALAIAATNAELRRLLAGIFADPKIHQAIVGHYSYSLEDCEPMTLTGFRLTCTTPTTTEISERSATWTSSATIEGEYNR